MVRMTSMAKGANIPLNAVQVRATLMWTAGPGVPDIDGSALLLGPDGHVASDDDFVFYNQPVHPSGAVRYAGKSAGSDVLEANLAAVPTAVERVVIAASSDGGPFGQVPGLRLTVSNTATGEPLAEFAIDAATETAMVCGELYRRDGQWKFRAVGQGYAAGLAGLAGDFGITVEDSAPAQPSTPAPSAPAQEQVPSAPVPAAPVPAAPVPAAPAPADDDLLDLSAPLPPAYGPPPSYTGGFPNASGSVYPPQ